MNLSRTFLSILCLSSLCLSSLCLSACSSASSPINAPVHDPAGAGQSGQDSVQASAASHSDANHSGQESGQAVAPSGQETDQAQPATPIADQYRDHAARIIAAATAERDAYQKLAYLTDHIGHRLSGSKALEQAVEWAIQALKRDGHDNVRSEKVMVPHWVRGAESARILAPIERDMTILGLGGTVGTGRRGVRGKVVVINDFDELEAAGSSLAGTIVLYNKAMPAYDPAHGTGYGEVSEYRMAGPSRAARFGAKAVLMRSVTARSLRTPHTGALHYEDGMAKIPAAAITTEDADLIARLSSAGQTVSVHLTLGARTLPDKESANVIAELSGRENPEEIVLIGAHLDSWDVGQGAHDDGAGCVIVMQALTVLRKLGLRPRRTIRVVLFTNEENGLRGAKEYVRAHGDEIDNHVMALEADTGGFAPQGFRLQGSDTAYAQMSDIITLLEPLSATTVTKRFAGADIMGLARAGVSALGLHMDSSTYFDYHHTPADTLDKVDPVHLAQDVAAVAVIAYVIADMPARFGQSVISNQ